MKIRNMFSFISVCPVVIEVNYVYVVVVVMA